jgi:hypothetical protein
MAVLVVEKGKVGGERDVVPGAREGADHDDGEHRQEEEEREEGEREERGLGE